MLGSNIKKLRKNRRLTQDDLAKKLGVSRQAVCMWESNKREIKVTILKKVAGIFSATTEEIMKILGIETIKDEGGLHMKRKKTKAIKAERGKTMAPKVKKIKSNFELSAPEAKSVILAGDFSAWDTKGVSMKRNKKGVWRTGVNLQPGRYEYKFIVDGQWWTDPRNDSTSWNAHGTQNSVKEIAVC